MTPQVSHCSHGCPGLGLGSILLIPCHCLLLLSGPLAAPRPQGPTSFSSCWICTGTWALSCVSSTCSLHLRLRRLQKKWDPLPPSQPLRSAMPHAGDTQGTEERYVQEVAAWALSTSAAGRDTGPRLGVCVLGRRRGPEGAGSPRMEVRRSGKQDSHLTAAERSRMLVSSAKHLHTPAGLRPSQSPAQSQAYSQYIINTPASRLLQTASESQTRDAFVVTAGVDHEASV